MTNTVRSSLSALLAAACVLVSGCAAGPEPAERVLSFHSDIVVAPDAALTVRENVVVLSAGKHIRRGIVREFPAEYTDSHGGRCAFGFELVEVLRDGGPARHFVRRTPDATILYIGEQDVLLPLGEHTYTIVFTTDPLLERLGERDGFHWKVTGHHWPVPIDEACATVELPPTVSGELLVLDGWTGPAGSAGRDRRITVDETGRAVFETTRRLGIAEGLTILVSWPGARPDGADNPGGR